MKDRQELRRLPIAVIAGVCGLALAAGGGIAWWSAHSPTQSAVAPTAPIASPTPTETPPVIIPVPIPTQAQTPQPQQSQAAVNPKPTKPLPLDSPAEKTVQVYWLKDVGGKFQIVPTKVALKGTQKPDASLQNAFDSLLAGQTDAGAESEIPQGTKLEGIKVDGNNVHVDLSEEFTSGGGSTSMIGRLGQVIFTATSLQPDAQVWISVNGKPLKLLGGEGLEVAQPSTRDTFEKDFGVK